MVVFKQSVKSNEIKNPVREKSCFESLLSGYFFRVGTGNIDSPLCGANLGFKGCLNVELHNHVSLDGENHKGKIFVRKIIHSCDKPECPICFKRGWAVREASAIEYRIKESAKLFGVSEHIVASVPQADYGLPYSIIKAKVLKALRNRGILGGVLIFHAQRYCNRYESITKNKPFGWYFSPHFHIIGFIDGGYAKCRGCQNCWFDKRDSVHVLDTTKCLACDGFEGRTRRFNAKEGGKESGYLVKVMGARKTIHGTAWYQLNHATIIKGAKRSTVATWFGVCSYTKLKLKKDDRVRRDVCPICQHELEDVVYVGEGEPLGLRGFDKYIVRD
ncbi:MAG: hypothetical protein ACQCN5_09140 [Candidatus Bathyarchaeia archaeon]|jgi:hypothetical protein